MNERWKYTQKFNGDDMVLIALKLDGCFNTLEELEGFGSRSRFFKTALSAEYVDNMRQFELSRMSEEKIEAINSDAKSMTDSICHALNAINELDDNDFDVPFGSAFPGDITCSRKALYYWLMRLNLTDIAEPFDPGISVESTQGNASKSRLNESAFWSDFVTMTEKAIDEFPSWREKQRNIRLTGNVENWLIETIGTNKRGEPEIIKKVLSDIFDIEN